MSWGSDGSELAPDAAPPWLKPLVDNVKHVKRAYRQAGAPRGAGDGHRGEHQGRSHRGTA